MSFIKVTWGHNMEIEDFADKFMKQKQWHEAQEGERRCAQCNSFKPWLRKAVVREIPSFFKEYKKGEIGECVEAGKLAVKWLNDVRCVPMLVRANGHCLLYRKMGVINATKRAFFQFIESAWRFCCNAISGKRQGRPETE
jgi:hypothetical protein